MSRIQKADIRSYLWLRLALTNFIYQRVFDEHVAHFGSVFLWGYLFFPESNRNTVWPFWGWPQKASHTHMADMAGFSPSSSSSAAAVTAPGAGYGTGKT